MSFKNKYCLLICCILFITCFPCFAEDTPFEINDTKENAYFIGNMKSLHARFETENDADWYKIIVTHPGMLKLVFTVQHGTTNHYRTEYVSLIDGSGKRITYVKQRITETQDIELTRTLDKSGIYYIKLSLDDQSTWDYLDHKAYYRLKILPMAGLVLANKECSEADVASCQSDADCIMYGGYWYDNRCNIEPCNAQYLSICPDEESCNNAGGYWSSVKAFCFNGDIADLEAGCPTNTNTTTQGCANFDFFTNSVHIPCLTAGDASYWLDLKLINNNPVQLELSNFGTNK